MSKLTEEQIKADVEKKGFYLVDASAYQNMKSPIMIKCAKGHLINTDLESVRKAVFECPKCNAQLGFTVPDNIPEKKGFRIIAFDNATEKMGVSIFDNGEVVFCKLFMFTGDVITRLIKIQKLLEEVIFTQWQPDFIVYEDIQFQQNYQVYKILAMLQGIIQVAAKKADIPYEVVLAKVWRSGLGLWGKNRQEEKAVSKAKVKEWFGLDAQEDVAEAILIGKYATRMHQSKKAF